MDATGLIALAMAIAIGLSAIGSGIYGNTDDLRSLDRSDALFSALIE